MKTFRAVIRRKGGRGTPLAWWILLLAAGLAGATSAGAATLAPSELPKVKAATFEVVQAKPTADPLTYAKPLPLDMLPYQQRTDKYYSIGTAFAIGPNRYVTAGHVLMAGLDSLWGPMELRDSQGHVYAIDKIEKFSLRRDFVVFSLAKPPAGPALSVDTRPAMNQEVYAVGNALGTGIVIRDGLYTSDTPEQQDGAWKWMRFSAAASPGNSGGPLLDSHGKVIGVVLMKSANENLNYALPIREVLNAPANKAVIDTRSAYQLDIVQTLQNGTFKSRFDLPLSLAGFYRAFDAAFHANSEKQFKALLARESGKLFPEGEGSRQLLYQQTMMNAFPTLIVRGDDGEWSRVGRSGRHFSLRGNGYVEVGAAGHNGLVHLRRPDDVDARTFYNDPEVRMDLMARTGIFERNVAGEKIKITSLGKPTLGTMYTDRWQRPWHVDVWPMPYANKLVMVYTLPVPDGAVMMIRFEPPQNLHDSRMDLDEMTSFVYVTYEGTLAQWKEYLKDVRHQPAAFRDIHIHADYGRRFSYASKRVAFSFTPAVQAITSDSLLWLGFRFSLNNGKPVWGVDDIDVWKVSAGDDHNNVNIQRYIEPPAGLDNNLSSHWQKLSQRRFPYNGVARPEDGLMKIDDVIRPKRPDGKPAPLLYTAFYGIEGTHPQAMMKRKLDRLMKHVRVLEH